MVSAHTDASFSEFSQAIKGLLEIESTDTPLEERVDGNGHLTPKYVPPNIDASLVFYKDGTNDYSAIEAEVDPNYIPTKKVSIVIPTYNRKDILQKNLAALVQQNYPHNLMEVIIADDGSSDGTEELVRTMDLPFDVKYVWQQDIGYRLAKGRNEGIKRATHDTVIILDVDMIPTPDFVRQHMKWHHAAQNIGVIGHRRYVNRDDVTLEMIASNPNDLYNIKDTVHATDGSTLDWRLPRYKKTRNLKDEKQPYWYFSGGNVSINKRQAFLIGLFDEQFNSYGGEDNEFANRLYKNGTFLIPELRAEALHLEHPIADPTKRGEEKKRARELLEEKLKYVPDEFHAPKVSIFIPAYNRESYIQETIESAIAQTIEDLEIVVCDDGSTDRTPEILKQSQAKYNKPGERPLIRVVRHPKNSGIGSAWNSALRAARGEYFLQLDSDDVIEPITAEKLAKILDSNRDAVCAYGNLDYITADSKPYDAKSGWNTPGFDSGYLFNVSMCISAPRMFRASAWFRTEGANEGIENAIDYDAMVKLAEQGNFVHYEEEILYHYRWHGKQTSQEKRAKQIANSYRVQEDGKKRRSGIPQKRFYVAMDDDAIALDAFSRMLNSEPNNVEAYVNMGIIFGNMHQYGLAHTYFSKALDLNPNHQFSRQYLERLSK